VQPHRGSIADLKNIDVMDLRWVTLCENGGGLADISKNSRVFQDYIGES
jgi:hypothetical protein